MYSKRFGFYINLATSLVIIFLTLTPLQAGGPWPQPKGKAYLKLSEWWLSYDKHYTSSGKTDPNVTSGVYNTTLYGEYGLTDRLTIVANMPIVSRSVMNNLLSRTTGEVIAKGDAITGPGDADLGLRFALNKAGSSYPFAASLTLGLPIGNAKGGEAGNLQTGDGEFNQLLQLHLGHSFQLGETAAYWSVSAGVNNRTEGFSDEFRFGLEAGINFLNNKFWAIGRLNGAKSFLNGETAANTTNTSIFANNAEFISPGLELNYYVSQQFGVSAGIAGAVSGKLIAAAPTYSVGVFLDLGR